MDLSKFTSNKNILSKIITLGYNNFVAKLCPYSNNWKYSLVQTYLFSFLSNYTKVDQNKPKWTEIVRIGPRWTKMYQTKPR